MWGMMILGVSLVGSGICMPMLVEVKEYSAAGDFSRDVMVSW